MKLIKDIGGEILLLEMPVFSDNRGSFIKLADKSFDTIRTYEQRQLNYVVNKNKYTCRGLHYQSGNFAESKIFRVLQGMIQVLAFNVDRNSPFYKSAFSQVIDNPQQALWIPRGFATGYCTLAECTAVLYSSDNDYHPEAEAGLRWDDPVLTISDLELTDLIISDKDQKWPNFI